MTTPEEEKFYGGSGPGAPTAKFPTVGTTVGGVITSSSFRQQKKMDTDELQWWPNGDPKMENLIIVLTNERDPNIEDDDGSRCIYVKGYMQPAVTDAVHDAGVAAPEKGGTLFVTYSGNRPSKISGFAPAKLFDATYTPATAMANAAQNSFDEEPF